jgi:hypothetical protein
MPPTAAFIFVFFRSQNMFKNTTLALGLSVALGMASASDTVVAGDFSYSFIEGGLSVLDVDGLSAEEGFNVRASAAVSDNIYLVGSWDRQTFDTFAVDVDFDNYRLGAGFHAGISATTDWFVELAYQQLEIGGLDDDAIRPDIGLRHALTERVEGRVFAGYAFGDDDDTALFGADLLFKFTDGFGLSVGAESFEFDDTYYRANLRLSF